MGRAPCCDKSKVRSGPWSPEEDFKLVTFIQKHGHTNWRALPKQAGLLRCGKSCRLRWINYLRPDVKRGNFTPQEEQTIIDLHTSIGNKWSKIASYLPGRTDNEIKNVWNTHLKKRLVQTGKNIAVINCHKNEANDIDSSHMDCSASSSSASSTSGDEKVEKLTIPDQAVPDSEVVMKNPNDDHHSPSSSHACNASDITCRDRTRPDQDSSKSEDTNNEEEGEPETRPDPDLDFWQVLDSLDPLQPTATENNVGKQENINLSASGESLGSEAGISKWMRFLESELGLTSDGDCLPVDQDLMMTATRQHTEIYNSIIQPELISPLELEYCPIHEWVMPCLSPCSCLGI